MSATTKPFDFQLSKPTPAPNITCPVTFQGCINAMNIFETSTCQPLQPVNIDLFNECECYFQVNLGYCYLQCPKDPDQQEIFKTTVEPQAISACKLAKMNLKSIPKVMPWETFVAAPPVISKQNQSATGSGSSWSPNGVSGGNSKVVNTLATPGSVKSAAKSGVAPDLRMIVAIATATVFLLGPLAVL